MMYKFYILALLTISFLNSSSQRPTEKIVFSSDGKIISFPTPIVTLKNKISFTVKMPYKELADQLQELNLSLKKTRKYLSSVEVQYDCLLNGFTDYLINLDTLIKRIETKNFWEISMELYPIKYFPVRMFAENFKNQFTVNIYYKQSFLTKVHLNSFLIDSNCIQFSSAPEVINMLCQNCSFPIIDELTFQLIKNDPLSTTIVDWYNSNTDTLVLSETMKHISDSFKVASDAKTCEEFINRWKFLKTNLSNWFLKGLWITGGKLIIDPLSEYQKSASDKLTEAVKKISNEIEYLQELQKYNEKEKAKLKPRESNTVLFKKLDRRGINLSSEIDKHKEELITLEKEINQWIKSTQTTNVLNLAKLEISSFPALHLLNTGQIRVQKQFDASSGYRPIFKSFREHQRITEIPEDEKPFVLIHNIDSNTTIKLDEKIQDFDDQEEFTKLVNEQLGKLDFSSISTDIFSNVYSYFRSMSYVKEDINKSEKQKDSTISCCSKGSLTSQYISELQQQLKNKEANFPLEKIEVPPVTYTTTPNFHSEAFSLKDADAPFKDSINFRQLTRKDTTVVGKAIVKLGKLRFLQIAAGLAFTRNPATLTSIDTSGAGFKISTTDNEFAAIAGFKIFPFKNYNRDNSILPRYPLRRISVFGGFEIIHPLKNFYLGGAYDIVPGLAFSYGNNYYERTNYQVQNGQVINTSRTYRKSGAYYSFLVNPTLFIQVIKLMFKQL